MFIEVEILYLRSPKISACYHVFLHLSAPPRYTKLIRRNIYQYYYYDRYHSTCLHLCAYKIRCYEICLTIICPTIISLTIICPTIVCPTIICPTIICHTFIFPTIIFPTNCLSYKERKNYYYFYLFFSEGNSQNKFIILVHSNLIIKVYRCFLEKN